MSETERPDSAAPRAPGRRLTDVAMASLFAHGDAAVVVIDEEQRVQLANPAVERMFGHSTADLIGRPIDVLIPERFHDVHREHVRWFLASTEVDRSTSDFRDTIGLKRDGSEFPAEVWLVKAAYGDGLVVSAVVRDMSDRVRSEEALRTALEHAERASLTKGEFLSRVSHELRTPLNAIVGFAQLLGMDELSEDQRDSVRHITRGSRQLLLLIDDLLEISQMDAGKLSQSLEPVDARDAVEEAVELVRPLAEERLITLDIDGVHGFVLADRNRLEQVLLNLLSNAIKYNRERGAVTVTLTRTLGRARLDVRDTGLGIPAERLDDLFVPFERLGAEATGIQGTGLGLALSKRMVEAMGGTMDVQSSVGEGSTFGVELFAAEGTVERHEAAGEAAATVRMPADTARTVLYVEDNAANVELIRRILDKRPGVQLISTLQGRIALDLARKHGPDLILLDLHLPDMSGEEVLQALKDDDATAEVPVVILSADATPGQVELLLRSGARGYVTKPLDVQDFLSTLDSILWAGSP